MEKLSSKSQKKTQESLPSSKSCVNSTRSSLPPNTKSSTVSDMKSDDNSTELIDDDVDEECIRKSIANFQKNYLELGQWPEVPVPVFQAFKEKYRKMKEKLRKCKHEKEKIKEQLRRYKNGEVPCKNCLALKESNSKTKAALEQAVQLSNMLLKELKRMESRDASFDD